MWAFNSVLLSCTRWQTDNCIECVMFLFIFNHMKSTWIWWWWWGVLLLLLLLLSLFFIMDVLFDPHINYKKIFFNLLHFCQIKSVESYLLYWFFSITWMMHLNEWCILIIIWSHAIYNAVFDKHLRLLAQYSAGNAFLCHADVDAGKWPPTYTLYNWSDIMHSSYDK